MQKVAAGGDCIAIGRECDSLADFSARLVHRPPASDFVKPLYQSHGLDVDFALASTNTVLSVLLKMRTTALLTF